MMTLALGEVLDLTVERHRTFRRKVTIRRIDVFVTTRPMDEWSFKAPARCG
jgi:hypothetical protein